MPHSAAKARARSADELATATARPLATPRRAVRCCVALRPVPTMPTPTGDDAATALLSDLRKNVVEDPIGADPLHLGLQVQDDPVAEGGVGDLADVVVTDAGAALEQRPDLAGQDERLGAARAGAVADVVVGDL